MSFRGIPSAPFAGLSFEQKLDRLAAVAVHVGLGLQPGQELILTASTDTLPLIRSITEHAYRAGAKLVTTLLADDAVTLARYNFAGEASFDYAPRWLHEGIASAFRDGAARLAIAGSDPALLAGQDPGKVSRASIAMSRSGKPAMDLITRHEVNWSIVASATPAWAALVFPDDPPELALGKLWDAIFRVSRITADDPVAEWEVHGANLKQRVDQLNAKRFHALHFRSENGFTDLTVGLADGHLWAGGGTLANNGIFCQPNIPTEECFTTPHCERVNGVVSATKPLSHGGTLIRDIRCVFKNGRIIEATATAGEQALKKLISTDDGARQLGEVALVPFHSPIAQSGILFYNTLFDENAASHIALGQAYSSCLTDGDKLSREQLAARGANDSLIHVDWMIGGPEVDVEGLYADGASKPLMRRGDWV